jgi:hypothetical protein
LVQAFLFQSTHLFQKFESAAGFLFLHAADCESNVNDNVIANTGFRNEIQVDLPGDASEFDFRQPATGGFFDFEDSSRNGKAHTISRLSTRRPARVSSRITLTETGGGGQTKQS